MGERRLKVLDLSKHMVTHMNKELTSEAGDTEIINLDQNSISKLENISHLNNLQQLSAGHNCLIKISGVENLRNLTVLNLPENSICSIEGIRNLTQLVWLNLSGNNIRHITGLSENLALKHLDLSDNTVTSLSDLSHLYALKALLLHGNIIRDLREAPRFLPKNLTILSLAENEINELTQVKNLTQLKKLSQLSMMNNPCVTYQHLTHHSNSYRAYILSWACNLEVLDAHHITTTERQNSSQLLTEGAAHKFSSGDQGKLIHYLTHIQFSNNTMGSHDSTAEVHTGKERPVTAGGREQSVSPKKSSGGVKKTKSDDKISKPGTEEPLPAPQIKPSQAAERVITQPASPAPSPAKSAAINRQGLPGHVSGGGGDNSTIQSAAVTGSPLVTRRDMQGLIRQVIGQERSPAPGTGVGGVKPAASSATAPKRSAALPKMSRSRSASRSPSRERRTPTSRKLILASSAEQTDHSGVYTTDSSDVPFHQPARPSTPNRRPKSPSKTKRPKTPVKQNVVYTTAHHQSAVRIQSLWRGYAARNLDPRVTKVKQEIRCRRLEETLAFVVGEMNRQQMINVEGQKVRSSMIAGIEALAQKLEELQQKSFLYTDPSAV